jgi:hypothetical protein
MKIDLLPTEKILAVVPYHTDRGEKFYAVIIETGYETHRMVYINEKDFFATTLYNVHNCAVAMRDLLHAESILEIDDDFNRVYFYFGTH